MSLWSHALGLSAHASLTHLSAGCCSACTRVLMCILGCVPRWTHTRGCTCVCPDPVPETGLRPLMCPQDPCVPGRRADGQAQAQAAPAGVPPRLVAVMSSHRSTPTEASRPALGNGNVNLIHGRSSAAARPEDRHAGRPIPWEEPRLPGC